MIKRENPGEKLHVGHRERMRKKFSAYGPRVFETYELLEMLLYAPIRHKDTNPIAKRLVKRFSTLESIFYADPRELCEVEGVGARVADFLKSVGRLKRAICLQYRDLGIPRCDNDEDASQVVLEHFRGVSEYRVSMIMLDNTLRVIGTKDICNTDYESAAVRPKIFIDAAIRARAAAVILAHSHPYGPLMPSPGDMETNRLLVNVLHEAGVFCIEHYVVSGDRCVGMMNAKNSSFYQNPGLRDFLRRNFGVSSCFTLEKAVDNPEAEYNDGELLSALGGVLSPIVKEQEAYELAKLLLGRYGNIPNVLGAFEEELAEIAEPHRAVAPFIKTVAAVLSRSVTELFKIGVKHTESEICEYFKGLFLSAPVECIYTMTFDSKGNVKNVHFLSEGTLNSAGISPRKIIEIAISDEASSVVVAHNHPQGHAITSSDDYQTTACIASALNLAGIELSSHYVVAGNSCEILKLKYDGSKR